MQTETTKSSKGISKMIMIQNGNSKNSNEKTSVLIYQEGDKMAQCNFEESKVEMDKLLIEKTVKQLKESICNNESENRLETEVVHNYRNTNTNGNGIIYYPTQQTRDNQPTNVTTQEKQLVKDDFGSRTEKDKLAKKELKKKTRNDSNDKGKIIILNNIYNSEEHSFGFKTCLICDKAFPINRLINADGCYHTFCVRCSKNYYEDKLEQGEPTRKCPVYNCDRVLAIEVMGSIVSSSHYKSFSEEAHYLNIDFEETKELKKPYLRKLEMMKIYTQKNVLDVNSNESMFFYSKAKVLFCPECAEMALFGKSGTHFIKCLNCFHSMCRYCLRNYSLMHMDITTEDHCKVYYRKGGDDGLNTRNKCMTFLIELFFIIAGFLFIIMGCFAYIMQFFNCLCAKRFNRFFIICFIKTFLACLLLIVALPIILLSFPYFPVVLLIIR